MTDAKDGSLAGKLLRALLHEIVNGIVIVDESGVILTFNPGAEKLFGWAAGEAIGRNVSILMPEPHRSAHDGYLTAYRRTGQAHIVGKGRELTALHRDGSTFPIHLTISQVDVEGVRQYVGIITRMRMSKDLQAIVQSMRLIVHGGLLRAIKAIEDSPGKQTLLREFDRVERLLRQAEFHFKLNSASMTLGEVNLRHVLERSLTGHKGQVRINGIVFGEDANDMIVNGNAVYIDLLFQVLLENAGTYATDSSAVINVARQGGWGAVHVANRGEIASADQKYLFDLCPPGESEDGGAGRPFGLSLVNARLIAERHGGDISCVSENGRTTFSIRFPLMN